MQLGMENFVWPVNAYMYILYVSVCICIYILYVLIYLLEGHQQRNYGWKNLGLNSGSTEVEGCYNREY